MHQPEGRLQSLKPRRSAPARDAASPLGCAESSSPALTPSPGPYPSVTCTHLLFYTASFWKSDFTFSMEEQIFIEDEQGGFTPNRRFKKGLKSVLATFK